MSYSVWSPHSRFYIYWENTKDRLNNPTLIVADIKHELPDYSSMQLTLDDVDLLYTALGAYLNDVEEERRKAGWTANTVTEQNDGPKTEPTVSDVTEHGHPTVKHTAASATTTSRHPLRSIYTWEDVEATVRGQQSY